MFARKKHLFFDKDNTITRSKTPIQDEHLRLLNALPHDIVVASGESSARVKAQTDGLIASILGQNGNHAFDIQGNEIWNSTLTYKQSANILEHINELMKHVDVVPEDLDDLIEHRGAQICYSIIGHNADITKKEQFDPDQSKRKALLAKIPFISSDTEVTIGGTTTFDYFKKGSHKGSNIVRLIDHYGWDKDECVYFGDMLMPGGNDYSVVGVIDTIKVEDYRDTYRLLTDHFGL